MNAGGESQLDCAVREVFEETGFNVRPFIDPEAPEIEVMLHGKRTRMFVATGVPEDTVFQPQTRMEIAEIRWWRLAELRDSKGASRKFALARPFLGRLTQWLAIDKKKSRRKKKGKQARAAPSKTEAGEAGKRATAVPSKGDGAKAKTRAKEAVAKAGKPFALDRARVMMAYDGALV